jgi:MFS family permease
MRYVSRWISQIPWGLDDSLIITSFIMSTAILYQMVPSSKIPIYGRGTFAVVALATLLGPLLGGVIDTRSTWRWIFLIK